MVVMKHLYFIRHGQSIANVDGVWGANTYLNNEGVLQAKKAAQYAKKNELSFDLIMISPSISAHDTAKEIALATKYPVEKIILIDEVKERHFGELEDIKVTDDINFIHGKDETYIEKYRHVESMEQLQKRAEKVLAMLKARPEDCILVASHSSFGRTLKRAINGHSYSVSETSFSHLPNAEIIKLI